MTWLGHLWGLPGASAASCLNINRAVLVLNRLGIARKLPQRSMQQFQLLLNSWMTMKKSPLRDHRTTTTTMMTI